MERRRLTPVDAPPVLERKRRPCGHFEDLTIDLLQENNVVEVYCLGCLLRNERPVERFKVMEEGNKKVKIVRLEEKK